MILAREIVDTGVNSWYWERSIEYQVTFRKPLTLEQANFGLLPEPFTKEEWDRLHRASRGER